MPHKKRQLGFYPTWIEDLPDLHLRRVLEAAWEARYSALASGADAHKSCAQLIVVGDQALVAIHHGHVFGEAAYRKAALAVRKYTIAAECSHPTASAFIDVKRRPHRKHPRRDPKTKARRKTTKKK